MTAIGKNLLVPLLLMSAWCHSQGSYNFTKAEMDTRNLVYSNPEAALPIIKKTLQQKGPLHDTVYGNTYHLYGVYHSMKGNQDSSIYYIKKSLPYLDEYPRIRARSLFTISMAYRKKTDYKAALKALEDILEINKKEKNNVSQAMVYGEIASNYNSMLNYDKSIDYLVKAVNILKAEKNTKQLTAVKQKLANTYLAKANYKFAIDLYKECLAEFKALGAMKNYYLTQVNVGEALIQINDLTQAKTYLLEAAEGLEKFGDKELIGVTYSKIGNMERMQKQYGKALASYKKAVRFLTASGSVRVIRIAGEYITILNRSGKHTEAADVIKSVDKLDQFKNANIEDRKVYQNAVADTYKANNDDKAAIKAYEHTIMIMDSIAASEKESAVEEIQAKFQTELQREKNLALEANNNRLQETVKAEQRLMALYILVSIALLTMILAFLRGYWLKTRLQQTELKTIETENELIRQQHVYEQELNNAQKEIIDEKQRELTSSALRMANYQDSINHIIDKCDSNVFTKTNDVKKELQQLIRQKDYWKQFETRFNSLHPEFNTSLASRFSKLTKNDLEFCSLLKLNLSNKEIASLLQISHESAITKKYRIKKKMDINDDEEFARVLNEM